MNALFRAIVLFVVCLSVVTTVADGLGTVQGTNPRGTYGINWNPTGPHQVQVVGDPFDSAARAGLRAGDELILPATTSFMDFQAPPLHATTRVVVQRDGKVLRSVALDATPTHPRRFDVQWALIRLFISIGALVILLGARPDDGAARALSLFLACIGLLCNWRTYPGAFAVAGFVVRDAAQVVGYPYFVIFASRFTSSSPGGYSQRLFGQTFERIAFALGALFALAMIAHAVLFVQSTRSLVVDDIVRAAELGFFGLGLYVLINALRHARGAMRQRLWWVLASLGIPMTGAVIWLLLETGAHAPAWRDTAALTMGLLPIGLSYAILRHHVLDITFALNRAIVWTIIASALVPFFGLVEFLINESIAVLGGGERVPPEAFFTQASNQISVFVNAAASIVVFASLRMIHERVDRGVKKALFRQRDRTLEELRQSCEDVCYVSDRDAVAKYLVDVFDEKLRVTGTAVYLEGTEAFELCAASRDDCPSSVGCNDPALLRLKACRKLMPLSSFRTAFPGAYAIPMARGSRLVGLCAVPYGTLDRSIAPDMLEAACGVARSAADKIDELNTQRLEAQLAALRIHVQSVSAPLVDAPPARPAARAG